MVVYSRTSAAVLFLAFTIGSVGSSRADDALAAKIGFPKNFDPVAGIPKAERLDNDKRIPLKVVRARGVAGKFVPAQNQPQLRGRMAGTSVDQLRVARAERARARKAAILRNFAMMDAANNAVINAQAQWFMRNGVGHY